MLVLDWFVNGHHIHILMSVCAETGSDTKARTRMSNRAGERTKERMRARTTGSRTGKAGRISKQPRTRKRQQEGAGKQENLVMRIVICCRLWI